MRRLSLPLSFVQTFFYNHSACLIIGIGSVPYSVIVLVTEQEDLDLCVFPKQTRPTLYGALCPDWTKWEGIPKNQSLLLHEQILYNTDNRWNTELINTFYHLF